jgi:hypothetical protein
VPLRLRDLFPILCSVGFIGREGDLAKLSAIRGFGDFRVAAEIADQLNGIFHG